MKLTLTKGDFRDAFSRMGRKDNFSYEGLGALYDHLEEQDEDYDLDVIGLCCEYSEDSFEDAMEAHSLRDIEELEGIVWMDIDKRIVLYAQY